MASSWQVRIEEIKQWPKRQKPNGYRGRSKSRGKDKFCRYCKKDNHDISECYKLKNKKKVMAHTSQKVNLIRKVRLLLLLMIVTLMVKSLLFLLDVQVVVMNGFLILLLLFIYANIEIGSSLMNLLKVLDMLGWMMILHILLLVLDPFKLRCLMALLEP